jgi:hypothetical protein
VSIESTVIAVVRVPLTLVASVAVLFDLNVFATILQHGFPPQGPGVFESCADGCFIIPTASTRETVEFSLFLVGVGIVQAVLFRLTWKAWRR